MRLKNIITLLSLLILCSCSVQKRHYTNGYYVSWGNNKNKQPSHATSAKKNSVCTKSHELTSNLTADAAENLDASADDNHAPKDFKINSPKFFPPEDSCDIIIFKDGSEVKVKVSEVGINEIKYKRCNNLDGPNHISRKSEIFMIKYANGSKEVVKSENPEPSLRTYEPQQRRPTPTYDNRNRRIHPLAVPSLVIGCGDYFIGVYCLSLVSLGAPYALLVIPVLLAIIAIVTGKIAINETKAHPETFKGKGLAIPGMIAGYIVGGIGLMLLFIFSAFN